MSSPYDDDIPLYNEAEERRDAGFGTPEPAMTRADALWALYGPSPEPCAHGQWRCDICPGWLRTGEDARSRQ